MIKLGDTEYNIRKLNKYLLDSNKTDKVFLTNYFYDIVKFKANSYMYRYTKYQYTELNEVINECFIYIYDKLSTYDENKCDNVVFYVLYSAEISLKLQFNFKLNRLSKVYNELTGNMTRRLGDNKNNIEKQNIEFNNFLEEEVWGKINSTDEAILKLYVKGYKQKQIVEIVNKKQSYIASEIIKIKNYMLNSRTKYIKRSKFEKQKGYKALKRQLQESNILKEEPKNKYKEMAERNKLINTDIKNGMSVYQVMLKWGISRNKHTAHKARITMSNEKK
jgi:hypothetical protein